MPSSLNIIYYSYSYYLSNIIIVYLSVLTMPKALPSSLIFIASFLPFAHTMHSFRSLIQCRRHCSLHCSLRFPSVASFRSVPSLIQCRRHCSLIQCRRHCPSLTFVRFYSSLPSVRSILSLSSFLPFASLNSFALFVPSVRSYNAEGIVPCIVPFAHTMPKALFPSLLFIPSLRFPSVASFLPFALFALIHRFVPSVRSYNAEGIVPFAISLIFIASLRSLRSFRSLNSFALFASFLPFAHTMPKALFPSVRSYNAEGIVPFASLPSVRSLRSFINPSLRSVRSVRFAHSLIHRSVRSILSLSSFLPFASLSSLIPSLHSSLLM